MRNYEFKEIEERITDEFYIEELPEDYKEVKPGTESTKYLEENEIR